MKSVLENGGEGCCNYFQAVPLEDYVRQFQETVDKASLVVAVLSEDFNQSKGCKQQVCQVL